MRWSAVKPNSSTAPSLEPPSVVSSSVPCDELELGVFLSPEGPTLNEQAVRVVPARAMAARASRRRVMRGSFHVGYDLCTLRESGDRPAPLDGWSCPP